MDLIKFTRQLMDIPSTSGDEAQVARFLAAYLESLNYRVEMQEVTTNRANLIAKTIQSALIQSYANYEIIVVDDGSTDNTESIVRNIKEEK